MGMYDCVEVPCPRCGKTTYFQSKGGDCSGSHYTIHDAPAEVLQDADRHDETCEGCGLCFGLKVETTVRVEPVIRW
jgi:hypothetical protein